MLNVDNDHPDCFESSEHAKIVFERFAKNTKKNGFILKNGDDKLLAEVDGVSFGFGLNNFYRATNMLCKRGYYSFDVMKKGKKLTRVCLAVPGQYNVFNALACFSVMDSMGFEKECIKKGLQTFCGVERRCQIYHKNSDVIVDYAHHPNEIKQFLQTVREMGYKKSRLVFQPHTYTRTKALFDQFADVLEGDEIFVLPTFAAREKPIAGFESCDLVDEIKKRGKNARYIGDVQRLVDILNCKQVDDEVILLVGAGDVDKIQTMLK